METSSHRRSRSETKRKDTVSPETKDITETTPESSQCDLARKRTTDKLPPLAFFFVTGKQNLFPFLAIGIIIRHTRITTQTMIPPPPLMILAR
jgi:hypothetical protein